MQEEPLKNYDQPLYSQKDMWWAITKTAIAVFVLSGIYFQFVQVKEIQDLDHKIMKERTEYVNDRIDTKHARQQKDIDALVKRMDDMHTQEK